MLSPLQLIVSLCGSLTAFALLKILRRIYQELTSPTRTLPGPESSHFLYGNLKQIMEDHDSGLLESWIAQYGPTIKFHHLFGRFQMFTVDPKAIHHVLMHTTIYQKSQLQRDTLSRIVGPGLLVVEGDVHRRQRKIMNPSFGIPQTRALTEIFVDKSMQLRDIMVAEAAKGGGVARIEAISWLSKATLDIIGLAGFNYDINALGARAGDAPNELAEAFEAMFHAEPDNLTVLRFIQARIPVLRSIPTKTEAIERRSQATIARVGRRLLEQSKREVAESGTFETGRARDLLTLLVRANTAKDIPESQRLSDEDVIAQVPTFLVAGHETTSTAVTWALFALTQNIPAQTRLREELLGLSTENPTMEELNEFKYLDCIVRETLRLYAPVPATSRIAMQDDVVLLSIPVTDKRGVVHDHWRVRKGDRVFIPILAMNRDVRTWGPDAMEFVPERWEAAPPPSTGLPGVWGDMLTFNGGPRACIGFRFSLVETKALLFALVRGLHFELGVLLADLGKNSDGIVQRPNVRIEPTKGNQLPLLVRPVRR